MSVAELDFTPVRTRGRAAAPLEVDFVRELIPTDLELLSAPRGVKAKPLVGKLRDRHHAVARLVASGLKPAEISAITGLCASRISILKSDPTFQDLIEHYRSVKDAAVAEFDHRASTLAMTAMNELQDRLEDSPEGLSEGTLLEIAKFGSDRTGNGPMQKSSLQVNVNHDLAGRLMRARERMATLPLTLPEGVVEGVFTEVVEE